MALADRFLLARVHRLGFRSAKCSESFMFRFRLVVWRLGSVAQRLGGLRFGLRVGSLGHRGCSYHRMGEMWFRFRILKWEFPEIRGTLFGGPSNKDPTI